LKLLIWVAWIAVTLAVICLVVGFISAWFGRIIPGTESVNFFHAANSFFLGSIALSVILIRYHIDKK